MDRLVREAYATDHLRCPARSSLLPRSYSSFFGTRTGSRLRG
jgi:hypothetical protein